MILQQFIDIGWHTVPLKGTIKRDEIGVKTIPVFSPNWRTVYTKEFNKQDVPLGGVITGKVSGIMAIDCDNGITYSIFKALDPNYNFHLVSKGKPKGGGTIIYKYDSDLSNFSLRDGFTDIDFYSDEGFIYLATEHNYTKEPWTFDKAPELREAPETIKVLLKTFKEKHTIKSVENKHISTVVSNRLAPMINEFVKVKKYTPALFKIITPKSFRDLDKYVRQGHIHPNDIPDGRGSEYLSKVSAILGADISISKELYNNAMLILNGLWVEPFDYERLRLTVIDPMINEKVAVDGKIIWQYDKYWAKMGFIATTMNGEHIDSFFDDVKGMYYTINYTVPYIKKYPDKRTCISTLKTITGRPITEAQYDSTKRLIRTNLYPSKEFGHIEGTDKFNLFRQTPELDILNYPDLYKAQYKRPETVIKFLETLIPDEFMRAYTLSFLRTKLTTFKYSPIVLYFIGAHGSGKDTFVEILRHIIGEEYIAKPDSKVFLEQYNGWLLDKYFIQLDEYGDKLNRVSDRQEALGKIKSYSGAPVIQIRAMRQDGFNYEHSMTIIITSNNNPIPLETQDRRIAFIRTPIRLDRAEWVSQMGGIAEVRSRILSEVKDFCYYLATEVKSLSFDDYVIAPDTADKERMIIDSMPAYEQIVYFIGHGQFDKLQQLGIENGIDNFTEGWGSGRIMHSKLADLYDTITEGQGNPRVLVRALKDAGINRNHTTKDRQNVFFYFIHDLHKYELQQSTSEFEVVPEGEFTDVEIEGL